jgi:hypothetical protein
MENRKQSSFLGAGRMCECEYCRVLYIQHREDLGGWRPEVVRAGLVQVCSGPVRLAGGGLKSLACLKWLFSCCVAIKIK